MTEVRRGLAALLDALALAAIVYLAFRLGTAIAPCDELSECPPLTPIIIGLALLGLLLYLGLGYHLLGTSPGRKLLGVTSTGEKEPFTTE